MEIFAQLGVNHTFWFQLVVFVITLVALQNLVFKDYAKALVERESRTSGNEEQASEYTQKTSEIYQQYEQKARQVNAEIKHIFDQSRAGAQSSVDKLILHARTEAQALVEETRKKVSDDLALANKNAKDEIPLIAAEMSKKLVSVASAKGLPQ